MGDDVLKQTSSSRRAGETVISSRARIRENGKGACTPCTPPQYQIVTVPFACTQLAPRLAPRMLRGRFGMHIELPMELPCQTLATVLPLTELAGNETSVKTNETSVKTDWRALLPKSTTKNRLHGLCVLFSKSASSRKSHGLGILSQAVGLYSQAVELSGNGAF